MSRKTDTAGRGKYTDYRIKWGKEVPNGVPEIIMYTMYKGHAFDGWISNENFARAESDGVLSWDEHGNPVIKASLGPDLKKDVADKVLGPDTDPLS